MIPDAVERPSSAGKRQPQAQLEPHELEVPIKLAPAVEAPGVDTLLVAPGNQPFRRITKGAREECVLEVGAIEIDAATVGVEVRSRIARAAHVAVKYSFDY